MTIDVPAVDRKQRTYDVKIDDASPMIGREYLYGADTQDPEGMPDDVIETYERMREETVADENGAVRSRRPRRSVERERRTLFALCVKRI